jgi:T1SS-143 domain-containing protein
MNGPFQVAQANIAGQDAGKPPARIVKVAKPFSEQSVIVPLSYDGSVKADLSAIAGEKITLVHIGEKLIILFDNKSTVTLEPFFDSTGKPLDAITVEVSPGRDLTGTEFAALFPVTEDQSVLPAAGEGDGNAQASGANFSSVGVDPLALPGPLDLLGQEELPNFVITNLLAPTATDVNLIPSQIPGAHVGGVTEEEQLGGIVLEGPSFREQLIQFNPIGSGGKEDPNDVTLPNSDGSASDGFDQDTPENSSITTQFFHGDGANALTSLVTGGNTPLTFTIDGTIASAAVTDGTGAVVKSAGHELHYSAVDTSVAGDNTVVGGYDEEGGFHAVFQLTVHSDGTYDFELLDKIDHPDHTTDTGSASNGHLEETLFLDFTTLVHVTDANNDGFTLTGNAFTIGVIDDTPEVSVTVADEGPLSLVALDESVDGDRGTGNNGNGAADDTAHTQPDPTGTDPFGEVKSADYALVNLFSVTGTTGEDGLGSVDFAFNLTLSGAGVNGGVATSLAVTDPNHVYGNDSTIYLFTEGDQIVGRVGSAEGAIALRISIENNSDPATAHFVVDQYLPVDHGDDGNNFDSSLTLTGDATLGVTLTTTVTDGDGDVATSSASVTVANNDTSVINIEDDGPTVTAGEGETTPLAVLNLDETIGADRYNGSETESGGGASNGADDKAATVTVSTTPVQGDAIGELSTGAGALANLFVAAGVDFGTDGPGANGGVAKDLSFVLSSETVGTTLTATKLVGTDLGSMTAAERAIELVKVDAYTIEGRLVGDGIPGNGDEYVAFRISIENPDDPATAKITVDQFLAIDHGGSENPSVFDEQTLLTLVGNGTLNLQLQTTVTDGDGDHVSLPVQVNLIGDESSFIAFDDDGPKVQVSKAEGFSIVHDETLLLQSPPFGDDNDILFTSVFNSVSNVGHDPDVLFGLPIGYARSTGSALSAPIIDYGTDGAAAGAAAKAYSLSLFDGNGAATLGPIDSKIETTDHHEIFLFKEGDFIVGRYDAADGGVTSTDPAAFALYIDPATGVVSLVQYVSLHHNSPDVGTDSDEYVSLADALGSVQATVTVTDGDGDKASASADISGDIRFEDDGPLVTATVRHGFGVTADETANNQSDDVTGPLPVFTNVTNVGHDPDHGGQPLAFATNNTPALVVFPYFGVDGQAPSDATVFSLTLNGGDGIASGLKITDGATISLYKETVDGHDLIVGRVDGSGAYGGQAAFAVSIDSVTGTVSVVEYLSLQHNLNGANPNDPVSIAPDKILATVTITDGDSDTASASADISGKISFRDDGPKAISTAHVTATVDEDGLPTANLDGSPLRPGETDGLENATAVGSVGALNTLVNFGADGPGSFGLKIQAAVDSGFDSKNQSVFIVSDGSVLTGFVDTDGSGGFNTGDRQIFTLTVGTDGSYTFTLKDQIDHPTLNNAVGDNGENLLAGNGIDLSSFIVATDGDNDPVTLATGTFTVQVLDDIPVVTALPPETTTEATSYTLIGVSGGNDLYKVLNGAGDKDILLSARTGTSPDTVNTSNDIGVGQSQNINGKDNNSAEEYLRIDFVHHGVTTGNNNSTTYTATDHYSVGSLTFTVPQVQQGPASLFLQLFSVPVNEDNNSATANLDNNAFVAISGVTVNGVAASLTAVYEADGTTLKGYLLEGILQDDVIDVTGAADFGRMVIANYDGVTINTGGSDTEVVAGSKSFSVLVSETESTILKPFEVRHDETTSPVLVNDTPDPNDADDTAQALPSLLTTRISALSLTEIGHAVGPTSLASLFTFSVGADEPGAIAYQLSTATANGTFNGVDSGLKTTIGGLPVLLYSDPTNPQILWGVTGADFASGTKVFAAYADPDGHLWLVQFQAIANDLAGNTPAAYDDIAFVALNLIHVTANLTDADGDTTPRVSETPIKLSFQDDGPLAVNDSDSVNGAGLTATGNVITTVDIAVDPDANHTDGVADKVGTDGAKVSKIVGYGGSVDDTADSVTHNFAVTGHYGTLTINENGDYTYTRFNGSPVVANDVFTYTLKDGDGDTSTATLTIGISDNGVTLNVPAAGTAGAEVFEAGLPARAGEPAGSNAVADSETTTGTITYTAPDSPAVVTIDGTAVTFIGQTFVHPGIGTLTITSLDPGSIGYSYTLADNTLADPSNDSFAVVVTDVDGDHDDKTLTINIVDDAPVAHLDTDTVAAGTYGPEAGNVITAVGTTSLVTGVDVQGADGAYVFSIAGNNPGGSGVTAVGAGVTINGQYGTLHIDADGGYSYTRNAGTPGGVDDVFTYTLKDNDGDTSPATLTISIADSGVTTNVPAVGTAGAEVFEAGLPARNGEPAGSNADADSETTTGSITYTAPDGPAVVTIDTVAVTFVGQTFVHPGIGTLTITSIDPGSIGYSYTLADNTLTDPSSDSFAVVVTDKDGDHDDKTLTIKIVDDAPVAHDDTDSVSSPVAQTLNFDDQVLADGGETPLVSPYHGFNFIQTGIYNPPGSGLFATYAPHSGDNLAFIGEKNGNTVPGYDGNPGDPISIAHTDGGRFTALGAWFSSNGSEPLMITVTGYVNGVAVGTFSQDIHQGGAGGPTYLNLSVLGSVDTITFDSPNPNYFGFDDFSYVDNSVATGNVITGADTTNAGADVVGADGAKVTQVIGYNGAIDTTADTTTHNFQVAGQYGTLTINEDGSYTYVRLDGAAISATDVFTYQLTDGDNDFSTATLTISIDDHGASFSHIGIEGGDVIVNEAALAGTRGAGESDGTSPDAAGLTQPGTFAISAPDGVGNLMIDGHAIVTNGVFTATSFTTALGNTFTVTAFDGTNVSYSYTLLDNEHHPAVQGANDLLENLSVNVTDTDGDTASSTLTVRIVDDVPAAFAGPDLNVVETDGVTPGTNLLANDTKGADGATLTHVNFGGGFVAITTGADLGSGVYQFTNTNGVYTFKADGTWTFDPNANLNNASAISAGFTYQITDGDDDTSTATQAITIADGAVAATPTAVTLELNEAALSTTGATGSNSNLTSEVDNAPSLSFTAGSDNLTSFAFAGIGNLVTDLNGNGVQDIFWDLASATQIKGYLDAGHTLLAVTLDLSAPASIAAGATADVTVTATLSDNLQHPNALLAQISSIGSVGVVATDIDGDQTTGTVNITVQDDVPAAVDDTAKSVAEDAVGTIGGNVMGNDHPGADGATLTHVQLPGSGSFVAITDGAPVVVAGVGTYTFFSNGAWTLDPVVNASLSDQDGTFHYRITDGDGDISDATQPITVDNTFIAVTAPSFTGVVEEEQLQPAGGTYPVTASGNEDVLDQAGNDTDESGFGAITATSTGNFNVTGGDGTYTYAFNVTNGTPVGLVGGGTLTSDDGTVRFYNVDSDTVIGYVDSGGTNNGYGTGDRVVFSLDITASGGYTFKLYDNIDHPTETTGGAATEESIAISLNNIVVASDGVQPALPLQGSITVIDDTPVAQNDSASVTEGSTPTLNAILVLDMSLSMAEDPAGPFTSRLALMKAAVANLLANSDVNFNEITVYTFGIGGQFVGTYSGPNAELTATSVINGLSANQAGTQYDAAAQIVRTNYPTLTVSEATQTYLYFLSDGDPQSGSSLDPGTEQNLWQTFLDTYVDKVIAVGFGGIGDSSFLQPMAPRAEDQAIAVTDPNQLEAVLTGSLPGEVSGNALYGSDNVAGGTDNDSFGADGGHIHSIKVGDITYTYDPVTGDISASSGGNPTQDTAVLTVTTPLGGTLAFNFATGSWNYNAPPAGVNGNTDEHFQYVIVDGDGDQAGATLTITVVDVPNTPPALALNEPGTSGNYRDEFGSVSYGNNNGSTDWGSDWTETDDNNSASNGDIRITGGRLRLGDNSSNEDGNAYIERTINLAGASSATLTFSYEKVSSSDSNEGLTVQAWNGTAWRDLTTAAVSGSDANGSTGTRTASLNADDTKIRFVMNDELDSNEYYYIDNVDIAYTTITPSEDHSANYTENGTAISIAAVGPTIADTDDTIIKSAKIVLTNAKAGDVLADGGVPAGISFALDATVVGVITVTLTGNASLADYQAAIKAVTYQNGSDNPSVVDRIIDVTVTDAHDNVSNTATTTIHVTAVNDAPTTDNVSTPGLEGASSIAITLAGGDADGTVNSFQINSLPSGGTLYSNSGLTTVIGAGGTVSASGNSAIVYFVPNTNTAGALTFQYEAIDNSGTHDGSAATATINITGINDAPSGTSSTISINEDVLRTFAVADFGLTDANDSPANTLLSVIINTLPTAGALTLNGTAVTVGQEITAANIPNLVFTPYPNESGTGYASFTFQVRDNGGTNNGGIDLDPTPNTITFNVAAVNDAPVIYASNLSFASSGDSTPFNAVRFVDTDSSGSVTVRLQSNDSGADIIASNSGGVTVSGGGDSDVTFNGTIAALNAYFAAHNVTYDMNDSTTDTVTISMDDGGSGTASASVTVGVYSPAVSNGNDTLNFPDNNAFNVNTTTINAGSGSDTIVTAWEHVNGTATTYSGGSGSDTIRAVFDADQLNEVLNSSLTTVRGFYDGSPNAGMNLGTTTWHAAISTDFEIAQLGIAAPGVVDFNGVSVQDNYVPLDTAAATIGTGTVVAIAATAGLTVNGTPGSNEVMVGTAVNQTLNGGDGNDVLASFHTGANTLNGQGGNDFVLGGEGADILSGGLGNDILAGGKGADVFKWIGSSATEAAGTANADIIIDYNFNEGDKLDLSSLLDANFTSGKPISDFVQMQAVGSDIVVSVDATGSHNFAAASAQAYTLVGLATLGADPVKIYFETSDHTITV